jgi:beta-galactosamide-alpha-2,3-sialyltransferase
MRNDLFICTTPLQVLIAKAIILSPSYEGGRPDFFMLVLSDSERYRYYYDQLALYCSHSEFIDTLPHFPLYLPWLWKRFRKKTYRNVYIASIDSIHAQYALSLCQFDCMRTFDDGTANIEKTSIYYNDNPDFKEKIKRVLRVLTGNRYSVDRIANETDRHYTIYHEMSNITEKLEAVDLLSLFKIENDRKKVNKNAVIFLGTVYEEVLIERGDFAALMERLHLFFSSFLRDGSVFYLPHPRDEGHYFSGFIWERSRKIAEEIILEKLAIYDSVVLVGFASSAQFNFINQGSVENIVLCSSLIRRPFHGLASLLETYGGKKAFID